MTILKDKILYDSVKYVCQQFHLELVHYKEDKVGKYAALLRDQQGRYYLFACRRYMWFRKDNPAIISFTKSLIEEAIRNHATLTMLIQDKDEENNPRNYLYMFNPSQILNCEEGWDNIENDQIRHNFPIWYCINMEATRRKEYMELYTNIKEKTNHQKDKMSISLTRFI